MISPISAITIAACAAVAYSQITANDPAEGLSVTQPSTSVWWVQNSQNTIAWTCRNTQIQTFTVLVSNTDPKILTQPQAFLANLKNADCSELIQASEFPTGPGYQILLANPVNQTDIYAVSELFEIKAAGSAFASVTTTDIGGSQTASSSSSATQTSGSAASSTSTGAATKSAKVTGGLLGLAAGLFAFLA